MVASDALLCEKICVWSLTGRNNFYLAIEAYPMGKAVVEAYPMVFVNSKNTKSLNIP
jgi:hypothetical protein